MWCWRRLLRVPWTARRSNQSILKEISLGISLEGLMLKLKLQYFGHLMQRVDSLEGLGAGGEGDDRGWDGWMASLTQWTWVSVNSGSWWWTGRPGVLWFMGLQRVRHDWATELNWCKKSGSPDGTGGKEPSCQCRRHKRHRFDPWVGKIHWKKAWKPTPVFFIGESHGQRSLVGYSPWGLGSQSWGWLSCSSRL